MTDAKLRARALQEARLLIRRGLAPVCPDVGASKAIAMAEVRFDIKSGELCTACLALAAVAYDNSPYPWEMLRRGPFSQLIDLMEAGPRAGYDLLAERDARRMKNFGVKRSVQSNGGTC